MRDLNDYQAYQALAASAAKKKAHEAMSFSERLALSLAVSEKDVVVSTLDKKGCK